MLKLEAPRVPNISANLAIGSIVNDRHDLGHVKPPEVRFFPNVKMTKCVIEMRRCPLV